jgi:hypothetical protein
MFKKHVKIETVNKWSKQDNDSLQQTFLSLQSILFYLKSMFKQFGRTVIWVFSHLALNYFTF